jgi:hypothetical protein
MESASFRKWLAKQGASTAMSISSGAWAPSWSRYIETAERRRFRWEARVEFLTHASCVGPVKSSASIGPNCRVPRAGSEVVGGLHDRTHGPGI